VQRQSIVSLCAFDVQPSGIADPVADPWPSITPADGAAYRWLHFDLSAPELEAWALAHLPEIPARALLQAETRPRSDLYEGGLILNLRGVNLNPGADPDDMVSVRMWVTANLVISVRMRKTWALDTLREKAEQGKAPASAIQFVVNLTDTLIRRIEQFSYEMDEATDDVEERVLATEQHGNASIATLRQSVIKVRRFVAPQREALTHLASRDNPLHESGTASHFRETANRATRTVEELDATRERLTALQEYVLGHQELSQSRNGYVLSVVAAIFLPLGFLTGLFGVNVAGMPGTEAPWAFLILSAVSVLIGIALFVIFRLSKWL